MRKILYRATLSYLRLRYKIRAFLSRVAYNSKTMRELYLRWLLLRYRLKRSIQNIVAPRQRDQAFKENEVENLYYRLLWKLYWAIWKRLYAHNNKPEHQRNANRPRQLDLKEEKAGTADTSAPNQVDSNTWSENTAAFICRVFGHEWTQAEAFGPWRCKRCNERPSRAK